MDDMRTLSESQVSLVAELAKTIPVKTSPGGRLDSYQSALCCIYAVRGSTVRGSTIKECEAALEGIRRASVYLETLREVWKPIAALGVPEEHPRVIELATMIENLNGDV
jgi:hypothetical protein